ncbi:MAG: ribosomal protein S18-alanine N-acetyltransferase [Candidatus Izemoplasmatales bacterium]
MRRTDIPNIVFNDRRILGQSLGEETLESELKQNLFSQFFVMEDKVTKDFLGHVGLWIDRPMASILNLYVVPEHQHHGFGKQLMEFVFVYLKRLEINTLTLEVRVSNTVAKTMYHQYGFEEVAVRKQYYSDGEDAFLMLKNIDLGK